MRFMLPAALALAFASLAGAQARPHPVGATPPWMGDSPDTLPPQPPPPPRELRGDGCNAAESMVLLVVPPVGGGLAGWLMGGLSYYALGPGLAQDRRLAEREFGSRRSWQRVGGAIGVAAGIFTSTQLLLNGCPTPPPRERVRRRTAGQHPPPEA